MQEKQEGNKNEETIMGFSASDFEEISIDDIETYRGDLIKYDIPVVRKNRDGNWVIVPIENLSSFLGASRASEVPIFIRKGWHKEINVKRKDEVRIVSIPKITGEDGKFRAEIIGKKIEQFMGLNKKQRLEVLTNQQVALTKLSEEKKILGLEDADLIFDASTDANLITKITMLEAIDRISAREITEAEAKEETKDIRDSSNNIINLIVGILSSGDETAVIFNRLKDSPEGSTIFHSNRVFMRFVFFLFFYNEAVNQGIVNKIRIRFKNDYAQFYRDVLENSEVDSLEDVVEKGLGRISPADFLVYATAALLHDIGKIDDLDYFEGEASRDFDRIKKHVYNGYNLMLKTIEYPRSIPLIAGYHHEYYGHKSGYGIHREFLAAKRRYNSNINPTYALSFDHESVELFISYAYFPAKIIEIIDIYDALTDVSRVYRGRRHYTPKEAVELMKSDFIETNRKIDPIIFDLYVEYLKIDEGEDFS